MKNPSQDHGDGVPTTTTKAATTTTKATTTKKVVTLSNKELRQHTLLQQQKSGIPTGMNDDQRSVDSSTGAAYQVPLHHHHHGAVTTTTTGRLVSSSTPSVMSERLSVISDVKADIYDCDDYDEEEEEDDTTTTKNTNNNNKKKKKKKKEHHHHRSTSSSSSKEGNIGQTEDEEDSPSSSPHATGHTNTKVTPKKHRQQQPRKNKHRTNPHDTTESTEHSVWTSQNIRLILFMMILFIIVTAAIIVVVLLTKPNHTTSSTTGNTNTTNNNNNNNGMMNPNNNTDNTNSNHSPNTSPTSNAGVPPPSQIYTDDAIQYIHQVLMEITTQTYAMSSPSNNDNDDDGSSSSNTSVWDDPNSPQVLARDWIIYQDSFLLSQQEQQQQQGNTADRGNGTMTSTTTTTITANGWMDRLLQRYALVLLYYATGGQYWVLNNQTTTTTVVVVDFANPTTSECTWTGVTCDDTKRRRYLHVLQNVHRSNHGDDDLGSMEHPPPHQHRFATAILSHEFGDPDPIRMHRMMQDDTTNYYGTDGTMNKVFRLYFQRMNLTGTIPHELGRCIPQLYELDLSQNTLYGTVPSSWFTPDTLWDTSLYWLDLSGNNLKGSIPSNIWTLNELRFLFLNNNAFTGRIERYLNDTTTTITTNNDTNRIDDDDLSNDTNGTSDNDDSTTNNNNNNNNIDQIGGKRSNLLKQIQLYDNFLTGPIPDWFPELSDLEQFIVFENELTGPLPDPIPASLIVFDVSFNQISGTIPIKLWSENDSPTKVERMYLDHNQLTGTIPNSTQLRQDMQRLWLNDNFQLTGTIPENFGQAWSRLSELQLHHTNVTGQLGPAISDDETTKVCPLVWPNLTILKANCLQRSVTDIPPVYCECCTLCESVPGRKRRRQRRQR